MNHSKKSAISPYESASVIKSFAFFDLETTGLPDLEFFQTKITELSIVACSVDHFLDKDVQNPRVLHKLTLCFNPYKRIDLKSTDSTGLTNEMLEHENKFDKNAMTLIECFVYKLQQPACLIAHNGNGFDFPLIKKQYDKLEGTFPFTMKCCDSLPVFRKIEDEREQKLTLLNRSYSLQQWAQANENGHSNSLINADGITLFPPSVEKENDHVIDEEFHQIIKNELDEIEKSTEQENNKISDDNVMKLQQKVNETTPKIPTKAQNLQPHSQIPARRSATFKRELFPSTSFSAIHNRTRKSFSLRELYKRLHNSYPDNSHDAESDVISLLKCAVHYKEDFVRIVNETCIDFKDIKRF